MYKIPLQNVEDNRLETYIGATARNFRDRLAEHMEDISKGNLNTALAQRMYEKKDTEVLWQDAQIIKNVQDRKTLPVVEKIEILKSGQTNIIINIRKQMN